jgi:preprotein translocase subunit SecF
MALAGASSSIFIAAPILLFLRQPPAKTRSLRSKILSTSPSSSP